MALVWAMKPLSLVRRFARTLLESHLLRKTVFLPLCFFSASLTIESLLRIVPIASGRERLEQPEHITPKSRNGLPQAKSGG